MVNGEDAPELPRYGQVIRGSFGYVLGAHTVSTIGDVAAVVALVVLTFERTHSPLLSSLVFTMSFVPYLVGGATISRLVDRLPPRATLCCLHLVSAALIAVMAIPGLPLPALLGDLLVVSCLTPMFEGERAAILARILSGSPYAMARSLLRSVSQGAQVLGYGLGGLLVVAIRPQGVLLGDAITFALSAALVLRVSIPPRGGPPAALNLHSAARRRCFSPEVKVILLFGWVVPSCAIAPEALAAPYVSMMHWSSRYVGLMLAATPVGATLADLLCARWMPATRQRRLLVPLATLTCVPLTLLALRPGPLVVLCALSLAGAGFAYNLGFDRRLIESASEENQSRVLATYGSGLMFAQGLGFSLWGGLAEVAPPGIVILGAAILGCLVVFVARPRTNNPAHDIADEQLAHNGLTKELP